VEVLALKGLKIIRYGSMLKPTVYKRLNKNISYHKKILILCSRVLLDRSIFIQLVN